MVEADDREEVGVFLTQEQIDDLGLICSLLRFSKKGLHGKKVENLFATMPEEVLDKMKIYVSDYRGRQEDYLYKSCLVNGKFSSKNAVNKLLHISIHNLDGQMDDFKFLVETSIERNEFSEIVKGLKEKKNIHRLREKFRAKLALLIYEHVIDNEEALKFCKSSYFAPKERAIVAKALMKDGRYDLAYEFSDSSAKNVQLMFARNAPIEFLPMLLASKHKQVLDIIENRFDRGY